MSVYVNGSTKLLQAQVRATSSSSASSAGAPGGGLRPMLEQARMVVSGLETDLVASRQETTAVRQEADELRAELEQVKSAHAQL
jgi:hypothetical protein